MSISNGVLLLEEKYSLLKKKNEELEETLKEKDKVIWELKGIIKLENFKNNLFSRLLSDHTEIKIPDIIELKDDGLHINNFEGGKIPIIVHEYLGETKNYNIRFRKGVKPNFRGVKKTELANEDPTLQEEKIRKEEEKREEFGRENNFNISKNDTLDTLESIFEKIIKGRVGGIEKLVENIKENRSKLLGVLNIEEYTKLVKNNITRLADILTKKKYESRKIVELTLKTLTPLEARLTFYKKYYDTALSIEDVQRLKTAMEYTTEHPKRYIPFSISSISTEICNYCVCVSSIKHICKRVFLNKYGFPNLIYLDREKSDKENDPYSFYSLEKIENGKRFWKMECRLDELSRILIEYTRNYCINMFRKIYFDVFSDNVYRENYIEKSCATKTDCEQLIQTIVFLSTGKQFCNFLRKLIPKINTIKPGVLDKFNIMTDDILVKKNFINETENKDEYLILKRLFDDIGNEDCEKLWNLKIN